MTGAKRNTSTHLDGHSHGQKQPDTRFPESFLSGGWRLPQGQSLPEFALEAGFLAPQLVALDSHIRPLEDLRARRKVRLDQ